MEGPAEALSAWRDKRVYPAVTLGWFDCLSVTMVTGDLRCLRNRVYCRN